MSCIRFGPQQPGLNVVKGAGEVEEHDTDSSVGSIQEGVGFLQQVNDCVINPSVVLIC